MEGEVATSATDWWACPLRGKRAKRLGFFLPWGLEPATHRAELKALTTVLKTRFVIGSGRGARRSKALPFYLTKLNMFQSATVTDMVAEPLDGDDHPRGGAGVCVCAC